MSDEEIQEPSETGERAEEKAAAVETNDQVATKPDLDEAVDVEARTEAYQIGVLVFVILIVLTIGEFLFAIIAPPWWWALAIIGILKAAYVIRDYMHVSRVFGLEGEEH